MNEEELINFLKDNLSIRIVRDQEYYSNPHIEVKLLLCGEVINYDQCTIYDGDRRD